VEKIIKCYACGHKKTFEACEECNGFGIELAPISEVFKFPTPCKSCDGTGIKGGRVVVKN
jgi:DnaJ-class molecular chaperone